MSETAGRTAKQDEWAEMSIITGVEGTVKPETDTERRIKLTEAVWRRLIKA